MRRPLLIFLCAWLFLVVELSAHPHIFITSSVEFVWDKTNLKGCYLEWELDRFFSTEIIRGFDRDKNGTFDEGEIKEIHNKAFINLKNYHFFTFIRQGKKRTNPQSVKEFSAIQRNGLVTYRFFVDLSSYPKDVLFLAVYDYSFYCEVQYHPKNPVKLTYDPAYVKPAYTIQENKDYPVYYDPLSPASDTTVHYTWKKGLKTFYPKEIRISYEN